MKIILILALLTIAVHADFSWLGNWYVTELNSGVCCLPELNELMVITVYTSNSSELQITGNWNNTSQADTCSKLGLDDQSFFELPFQTNTTNNTQLLYDTYGISYSVVSWTVNGTTYANVTMNEAYIGGSSNCMFTLKSMSSSIIALSFMLLASLITIMI